MSNKNQEAVKDIASKHLGKVGGDGYSDQYNPELLVKIPRYLNREGYDLTGEEFVGYDIWNAYEVSALTNKGLPVSGMLKIVCPSNTEYHVESKSIKLYLNSYNMTKLGDTTKQVIEELENRVTTDLENLLGGTLNVKFHTNNFSTEEKFDVTPLSSLIDLDNIKFTSYHSDAGALKGKEGEKLYTYAFQSDLLRSNCRVTNQPDWGDVIIKMSTKRKVDFESIAKYIVSHRKVSHFHEEICEMIYKHFTDAYEPTQLMVACLYTRRGGIDINPIRATDISLIPDWYSLPHIRIAKTLRQ